MSKDHFVNSSVKENKYCIQNRYVTSSNYWVMGHGFPSRQPDWRARMWTHFSAVLLLKKQIAYLPVGLPMVLEMGPLAQALNPSMARQCVRSPSLRARQTLVMSPSPSLHGERKTDLLVEVYGSQENCQQIFTNLPNRFTCWNVWLVLPSVCFSF